LYGNSRPRVRPELEDKAGSRWGSKGWEGSVVSRSALESSLNLPLEGLGAAVATLPTAWSMAALLAVEHLAHF